MNPIHNKNYTYLLLSLLLLFSSCAQQKKPLVGEYVFRKSTDFFFTPPPSLPCERPPYPWERQEVGGYPLITKEFFRCKGNPLNPVAEKKRPGKESFFYRDCSGNHGLPLRKGKEFVYPCLLDLLNYIQERCEKQVVITTGHRCPVHNIYADSSSFNWGSKHMLGAEVDFYVEGMERESDKIITLIQEFYGEEPFKRYTQGNLNVSTEPWYNKEVFVKLYLAEEGRDADNQHPYPYIGIQVRFDRDTGEKVTFDQTLSENYLRN
ncbi:MAG: hypothetical protein ACKVOH_03300 [Chlamydiales bacterium]